MLKTKEQRAAEKALLDKSPLKTLTMEEFLESERHKLTGTLTPVTPETFAKWKKERLDKKAAEEQLRKAKEATGRALFESGNWKMDEEESDEEDEGALNLEKLRQETEALRIKREEERLAALHGLPQPNGDTNAAAERRHERCSRAGSSTEHLKNLEAVHDSDQTTTPRGRLRAASPQSAPPQTAYISISSTTQNAWEALETGSQTGVSGFSKAAG